MPTLLGCCEFQHLLDPRGIWSTSTRWGLLRNLLKSEQCLPAFVTLIVSIPVCDPVLQGPGGMRLRLGLAEIPQEMEIPQQPNCQQHFTVILLRHVWGGRGDDQNHQYVQQDCSPDLSVCHGGSQKLGGEKTQPASHIHCGGAHGGMSTRLNS